MEHDDSMNFATDEPVIEGNTLFDVRKRWFSELSCPSEHAAFAAIWARQVVPGAKRLAGDIKGAMGELHLSTESQESVAKAHQLAEMLHAELRNIQFNTDREMSGEEHTPAKEVIAGGESAEVASSVETPRKPSAAAGSSFLPELWVCEECGHSGDPNEWSCRTVRERTHWEPEEKAIICPSCKAENQHREADVEWLKEILAGNDAAIILVETLNNE